MNADAIQEAIRRVFDRPEVACAWLFGSRARGTNRRNSDVDVAVLYEVEPTGPWGGHPCEDEDALVRELHLPVQVIVANRASADLLHRVFRDGILVVERDRSRRVAFEVRRRNEYFDLLPTLRRIRRPRGPMPARR